MKIIIRIIGVLMALMGCFCLWYIAPYFLRFATCIFDDQFSFVVTGMTIVYGLFFALYGLMTVLSIGTIRLIPRSIRLAIPVLLVAFISDVVVALGIRSIMHNAAFFVCDNPTFLKRALYTYWILLIAANICFLFVIVLWMYKKKLSNSLPHSDTSNNFTGPEAVGSGPIAP